MKLTLRSPIVLLTVLGVVLLVVADSVFAENIDPNNDDSQFAFGENAGWLNAEPANCAGCGVQVSPTELTGYIWGENIGWINLNCANNAACGGAAGNWRVTNDGSGVLSGYAWSENAGWISFSCQNLASCGTVNYGVTISRFTDVFTGFAWGENVGWIRFSDDAPFAYKVQTDACVGVVGDDDCDRWLSASEGIIGTDPLDPCADTPAANDEADDKWPADVNDSQFVDVIGDIAALAAFAFQNVPPAPARYDVGEPPNGSIGVIDDLARLASLAFTGCVP